MLSGQSSIILTSNYTKTSSYNNAKTCWTINKYTGTSIIYTISQSGDIFANNGWIVTNASWVRPVIKVKTNLTISKGNGTWNNPYEI